MTRSTLSLLPAKSPNLWQRWLARRRIKRRANALAKVYHRIAHLDSLRALTLADRAYHAALPGQDNREMVSTCDELLSTAHEVAYALHKEAHELGQQLLHPFRA